MRLLCQTCYYARGIHRPATNLDAVRDYQSTPACDDCTDDAGAAHDERMFAAYHGGGSVSEFERSQDARRSK